jgi:hypothetical protein
MTPQTRAAAPERLKDSGFELLCAPKKQKAKSWNFGPLNPPFAKSLESIFVCGEPLADTMVVRQCFLGLARRANVQLETGDDCRMIRHTVITEIKRCTTSAVGEAWGHNKLTDSTSSRHYDLREIREQRKEARANVTFEGRPACDFLPWRNWKLSNVKLDG